MVERARQRRSAGWWAIVLPVVLALLLAGCTAGEPHDAPAAATVPDVAEEPEPPLTVQTRRDGDSFVASDGVEYRVGLINTPEGNECGGTEASARTYELLEGGFSVEAYSEDANGRTVARVRTPEGDLGVLLAEEGLADDRYLEQFRSENPAYAVELDAAFDRARQAQAGLHTTCWAGADAEADAVSQPLFDGTHGGRTGAWDCHPAYVECLPDGPDLDCREVGHRVVLVGSDDPFRLDGNSTTATDGVGCDTFPPWAADDSYPYY